MLQALLLWVTPVDTAMHKALQADESEVVDACRALSALTQTHKAPVLQQAAAGLVEGAGSVFGPLQQLTEACLATLGREGDAAEQWLLECAGEGEGGTAGSVLLPGSADRCGLMPPCVAWP
jgi:hypothetical protein